ncbi:hypothetical protein CRU93_04020 [Arcobacter sp. CECT 8985]|nr:hypothetical protein CRU93_04020 [Arcobacter sp. CECT 8985]
MNINKNIHIKLQYRVYKIVYNNILFLLKVLINGILFKIFKYSSNNQMEDFMKMSYMNKIKQNTASHNFTNNTSLNF